MNVLNENIVPLLKGEKGDGLEIKKYYDSVEAMNADYSNADIAVGDTVAIKDTLALYVKGATAFESVGTLKGADGTDGTTFTPSVSNEGVLSWTNDGGKENPTAVNIKGADGEGVPSGGTAGQFLQKTADGTAWADVTGGTGGGSNVTIYADDFEASEISITNDVGTETMKIYFTLPEPNAPSNPYMSSTNTTYGRYATAKLMIGINDDPMTIIEIDVPSVSNGGNIVVARAAGGINANVVYRVSTMQWVSGKFYITVKNVDEVTAPAGLSIEELKEKTLFAGLFVNNFVVGQSE